MGSWGYKAIESDNGLDLLDFFKTYASSNQEIKLGGLLEATQKEGLLPDKIDDIDFLYDVCATSITELFFDYKETGKLEYEGLGQLKSFNVDKADLEYLLQFIQDIYNEKPDQDGEREYSELFKEVDGWTKHIQGLILKLQGSLK